MVKSKLGRVKIYIYNEDGTVVHVDSPIPVSFIEVGTMGKRMWEEVEVVKPKRRPDCGKGKYYLFPERLDSS